MTRLIKAIAVTIGILLASCKQPAKENISKYPQLFANISQAMLTNGFSEVRQWPWYPQVVVASITNMSPGEDTKFYLTGSYEHNDYVLMKVVIGHSSGHVGFAGEWSSSSNRPLLKQRMETMIQDIVKQSEKK